MQLQSGIQRRFKDETGNTYGRLTVLRFEGMQKGQPYFVCRCDCGKEVSVRGANLRSGNTTSCGCSRKKFEKRHRGKMVLKVFGHVLVLGKADPTLPKTEWVTICTFCNRFCVITERKLRTGKALFCKCLTRTYTSWRKMIERCTNKNHAQYKDYGGRGITICERWRKSFSEFLRDMGRRPEGKTLDRINNDGGYSRENCRWATPQEQTEHRR
jgi:hypothetical protein